MRSEFHLLAAQRPQTLRSATTLWCPQSTTKLIAKIQTCLAEGAQLGWLLDPTEEIIMVFWRDRPLAIISEVTVVPVLLGIELPLTAEQIFGWLKP